MVHDPFLSDTAQYADIVLPAATYLETEDLYRAYGTYYMQYAPAAVPPQGEAWSELATRAGAGAAHGAHRSDVPHGAARGARRELFQGARRTRRLRSIPDRSRCAGPIRTGAAGRAAIPHAVGQARVLFRTTGGRRACRRCPTGSPDPDEERQAARWPLRLLTAPGYFQAHTAFSGVGFLREREGQPVLRPAPRRRRRARLDRRPGGASVQRPRRGRPGAAGRRRGPARRRARARPAPGRRDRSGTVNMLCSDRYTDMGEGATYQSTWLDVEAS